MVLVSVYVDDQHMVGKKESQDPYGKLLRKDIDLCDPTHLKARKQKHEFSSVDHGVQFRHGKSCCKVRRTFF